MSGTSLDGLDIAYCSFVFSENKWSFKINEAQTIKFPNNLNDNLKSAIKMSGLDLMKTHNELGNFIGESINEFISNYNIDKKDINFISSHGHTIFHQPNINLTTQIGNGANISSTTQLPVICDFRTTDLALGGQGAPLVPIGDQLLFSEFDYCINLGGIANTSYKKNTNRIAFDICPVNIVLNRLTQELGKPYDNNGELAKSGRINQELLKELNKLDYYRKSAPKSLGFEEIEKTVFPLIDSSPVSTNDKLRTFVEHISIQISNTINKKNKSVILTGGGTFNSFLAQRIKANTPNNVIIPDEQIIDFKEALIFGFLGVLRLRNESNCLKSVTGASSNNTGGCIYRAF